MKRTADLDVPDIESCLAKSPGHFFDELMSDCSLAGAAQPYKALTEPTCAPISIMTEIIEAHDMHA